MEAAQAWLQRIPAVDRLLREPAVEALRGTLSHETVVALIREALARLREEILAGRASEASLAPEAIAEAVAGAARSLARTDLRRVLNATGILIHTNLGRAPLSASAQAAIAQVAGGYANLELNLESGARTSRLDVVRELLRRVAGAEDALAVHNNAAAVFLILHALAAGREAIVSRGELVEIGGSFRLPDIMAASGARLREVGTTNRTTLADYEGAIGPETGLILRVHPSNFVMTGFVERPALAALASLARERGLPCVEDIGSGALAQHPSGLLREEPRVQEALAAGADLVCFSGDKLLGGPQAGIILGAKPWIERLRRHPVARIVRMEKILLAGLEATLREYLRGPEGVARIPLHRMALRTVTELRETAGALRARITACAPSGWRIEVRETEAAAGGGSLPGQTLPSVGLAIRPPEGSLDDFARRLRVGDPALVGRIERDELILDLRSLAEEEWTLAAEVLTARMRAWMERGAR